MNIAKVKIVRLLESARELTLGSHGAAAFDVAYAGELSVDIRPGEVKLLSTGWSFEIPEGYAMMVLPRSGLSIKRRLRPVNSPGLIDSDYRGELFVALENGSRRAGEVQTILPGDYVAQLLVTPTITPVFERVNRLGETERGEDGFGSTELRGRNRISL